MFTRHIRYLACTAAMVAGVAATPPSALAADGRADRSGSQLVVHPGESIQAAVDRAKAGDTITVLPGTYRESVQVSVPGLTLRGMGHRTVLVPGSTSTGERKAAEANACAKAGHGICVTGTPGKRVSGVTIRSLTVSGFPKNGVWGSETDQMTVTRVLAKDNGEQGIGQHKSTRGVFRSNISQDNGESGVFLANTVDEEGGAIDTGGALIAGNHLTGNRIGVVIRRARALTVERNVITGNCGGVFVIGDEGTPRGGALTVRRNHVNENTKHCPATARLPHIQGTGILLTGVEDTLVTGNQVMGNTGDSPMSGGIVLFRSVVGVPNTRISVQGNTAMRNGPEDLANRDTGTGNTFTANRCDVSAPSGLC